MSDEQEEKSKAAEIGPLLTYIVSGLVAAALPGGAGSLARAGVELATAATTPTLIRDQAAGDTGASLLGGPGGRYNVRGTRARRLLAHRTSRAPSRRWRCNRHRMDVRNRGRFRSLVARFGDGR